MSLYTDNAFIKVSHFLRTSGLSKAKIAALAGIGESVVRYALRDVWDPRISTLRKLEAIIPPDFSVDVIKNPSDYVSEANKKPADKP